ncbi:amino acid--tRNA ligase-related protein [Trichlorobacter thiogenes]|uniref:amino acid--tRNA ligase-related protein n=1 Tax=Trichlorobacter thiogenes TaxID=115783 RepID=UPI001FCA3A92|nr:amino acid--tRNA ligase-related protein [Trichlorobacter thiogenes]
MIAFRGFPQEELSLERQSLFKSHRQSRWFTENLQLTDPLEQRTRFEEANLIRQQLGKTKLPLPEPFLTELSAMPSSAGIALGVDRLVMLTTGAERIDQVVAFTPESL